MGHLALTDCTNSKASGGGVRLRPLGFHFQIARVFRGSFTSAHLFPSNSPLARRGRDIVEDMENRSLGTAIGPCKEMQPGNLGYKKQNVFICSLKEVALSHGCPFLVPKEAPVLGCNGIPAEMTASI